MNSPALNLIAEAPAIENTMLFLSYGQGWHVKETVFSILSAFHFLPPGTEGCRYVVYTDQPEAFRTLGVEIRPIPAHELEAWLGGGSYIHRRKLVAMIDALERFGGKVVFVDSDTYFRRSPAELFDRVGPGRSCLHVMEGGLLGSGIEKDKALSDFITENRFHDTQGAPIRFSPDEPQWNSGVVGVDAADTGLLREALHLVDQMHPRIEVHMIEQFATGYMLSRTDISECRDVVFHYWPDYLRDPFRGALSAAVERAEGESLTEWVERAYATRPKPGLSRRAKMFVKERLRRIGVNIGGSLRSA